MKKISIFGLGQVGLSTAVVIASKGLQVIGVDIDKNKIKMIHDGNSPFFEPNLKEMLEDVLDKKDLIVTDELEKAVLSTDISFICVGTPANSEGDANLSFVEEVSKQIGLALSKKNEYHIVVVKSTVTPLTTENIVGKIIEKYSNKKMNTEFGLAFNPEFLREGSMIDDSLNPHLIILGCNDSKTTEKLKSLFVEIYQDLPQIIETNITTSELIKYANNSFLATKISFINTIANICNKIPDVDVGIISNAIGLDPRIGSQFLKPGPGYGGSCLPKDIAALIKFSKMKGYDPVLLESTQIVNNLQINQVIEMIENTLQSIENKTISVLGLSFKKDTDDIRNSVSIRLIKELLKRESKVKVHDPKAIQNTKEVFGDQIEYYNDISSCISNSDCCVLMTDWDEYTKLQDKDFQSMKESNIVDARRILDYSKMKGVNLKIMGVGK